MKKTLAIVLALVMLLTASVTLISCSNKNPNNVVGVYEMTDISGTLTNNGQVTQLSKDLYRDADGSGSVSEGDTVGFATSTVLSS